MAAARAEVSRRSCVKGYPRMHRRRQLAKNWYARAREQGNVHDLNPTKFATISKYGMNVDNKA